MCGITSPDGALGVGFEGDLGGLEIGRPGFLPRAAPGLGLQHAQLDEPGRECKAEAPTC